MSQRPKARSSSDARVARGAETRARILATTRAELRRCGQDMTLDDIAARLAITKQAVLYHFPSKDRLLVELALGGIAEEAAAMIAAVESATSAGDAIRRFLLASVAFHTADLERFRLIYVRAQVVPGAKDSMPPAERAERLYPVTSRMYAALEAKLRADPKFPRSLEPRTLAVSVHLAALGFATMAGELEGGKDNMKLSYERYAEELARTISLGFAANTSRTRRPKS
jgi:AcrR family transcriptional regulator